MRFVIVRKNEKTVQVWEDNDASWDFFIGGMSHDVQWHVLDKYASPKKFHTFTHAKWYLDHRAKKLRGMEKTKDKEWEYHILKEDDIYGVSDQA